LFNEIRKTSTNTTSWKGDCPQRPGGKAESLPSAIKSFEPGNAILFSNAQPKRKNQQGRVPEKRKEKSIGWLRTVEGRITGLGLFGEEPRTLERKSASLRERHKIEKATPSTTERRSLSFHQKEGKERRPDQGGPDYLWTEKGNGVRTRKMPSIKTLRKVSSIRKEGEKKVPQQKRCVPLKIRKMPSKGKTGMTSFAARISLLGGGNGPERGRWLPCTVQRGLPPQGKRGPFI